MSTSNIFFENKHFTLTLGTDCIVKSLKLKATGEELLIQGEETALFSLTEDRPYNNEIKLAHPNKRTTFEANRVRMEDDHLIVGFELVTFEAVVDYTITDDYMAFTLADFRIKPSDFDYLAMTPPPVTEFRLLQLPIRQRAHFGEWLSVMHDDTAAVCILAADPFTRIDSDKRRNHRILHADSLREFKLKNCPAVLIACSPDSLLDCIDSMEVDYDLPRGVQSRRSKQTINASVYWVGNANPTNIDEHIAWAKQMGYHMMLFYYTCMFQSTRGYLTCGNYDESDFRETYPNGYQDLIAMLGKVKAAGITPGLHFLQTHIGLGSRYVTPVADHRLNLTRHFMLAKPVSETDDTIYVEQNPLGCVMHEKCRVLKFDGELIQYESYSTERPYCFKGCRRGAYDTTISKHHLGCIGGILDISEFGATSVYLDQTTDLQDEIAANLAKVYNCGFEFVYFDGSEGTNPPFEIYVPYAQYRVYKAFDKAPLFCEGAAKAHFSWHMLSGGNAFDIFPMNIFKEKIAEFPLEEAGRMIHDFTRLNFGWWKYAADTMPDIYEYGTSKAASWDCPVTLQTNPTLLASNPRTADTLEVLRRWEDVRRRDWLTTEQKEMLRDPNTEYTLLINEEGDYELVSYDPIHIAKDLQQEITAYFFERKGLNYVVCWHTQGKGKIKLALSASDICYEETLGDTPVAFESLPDGILLPVSRKHYLHTAQSKEVLLSAFEAALLFPDA